MKKTTITRRHLLKQIGLISAASALTIPPLNAKSPPKRNTSSRESFLTDLKQLVESTPMVDSHEHLADESERLKNNKNCIRLFEHYLGDDFVSAGLDRSTVFGATAEKEDPVILWRRLQPFWNAVKNTGYGQAVRHTIKELYGIEKIDENEIPRLQQAFEKLAVPGFYEKILRGHTRLDSCQNDRGPYTETTQPTLLLQDINISNFLNGAIMDDMNKRVGITAINDINDYHEFIRRWFKKYSPYATAVKTQIAYSRGLNFEKVPAEVAEEAFKKRISNSPLNPEERKLLQDHFFWFCVGVADEFNLPIKLHTGYYVGNNSMPVSRVEQNVSQAADLCINSPKTRFVFMHTAYPYGHELISVAKHFTNAFVQTCWAWIIDPLGTKDFLKRYIVSAPASKIHTFGGDYSTVENVVGHARLARNGVYSTLAELVDESYLSQDDALELVDPLLRGNARQIFNLEKKQEAARNVPWNTTPQP